jgi:hypothetical protein
VSFSTLQDRATGRIMEAGPTNTDFARIVEELSAGRSVAVTLQPGDGFEYDLMITPITQVINEAMFHYHPYDLSRVLLVTRVHGGGSLVRCALAWRPSLYEAAAWLADGNLWTREVLEWWLEGLFNILNPGRV